MIIGAKQQLTHQFGQFNFQKKKNNLTNSKVKSFPSCCVLIFSLLTPFSPCVSLVIYKQLGSEINCRLKQENQSEEEEKVSIFSAIPNFTLSLQIPLNFNPCWHHCVSRSSDLLVVENSSNERYPSTPFHQFIQFQHQSRHLD